MTDNKLIGCFYQNELPNLNDGDQEYCNSFTTSLKICLKKCSNRGYRYASLKFKDNTIKGCMCDNQYNRGKKLFNPNPSVVAQKW